MRSLGLYTIRPLLPSDQAFLREMLYQSFYVPAGAPPFERSILDDPKIARYVRDWGRAGDTGFVAMDQDQPVGAAWARRLTADESGFGYIDDQTPELGIAIEAGYRGRGIGAALLEQLIDAVAEHHAAICLSVSPDNPALRLYERLGFAVVGEDAGGSLIMKKLLDPA